MYKIFKKLLLPLLLCLHMSIYGAQKAPKKKLLVISYRDAEMTSICDSIVKEENRETFGEFTDFFYDIGAGEKFNFVFARPFFVKWIDGGINANAMKILNALKNYYDNNEIAGIVLILKEGQYDDFTKLVEGVSMMLLENISQQRIVWVDTGSNSDDQNNDKTTFASDAERINDIKEKIQRGIDENDEIDEDELNLKAFMGSIEKRIVIHNYDNPDESWKKIEELAGSFSYSKDDELMDLSDDNNDDIPKNDNEVDTGINDDIPKNDNEVDTGINDNIPKNDNEINTEINEDEDTSGGAIKWFAGKFAGIKTKWDKLPVFFKIMIPIFIVVASLI